MKMITLLFNLDYHCLRVALSYTPEAIGTGAIIAFLVWALTDPKPKKEKTTDEDFQIKTMKIWLSLNKNEEKSKPYLPTDTLNTRGCSSV